ncbi:P-loop containing nucleoside triphosphate hydrolase protein [Xylariaceae sp. FL1272]|nr:P-loop containing nucleoside triphosphate hydrolase protein [Xylariaceae sp. FL1272]
MALVPVPSVSTRKTEILERQLRFPDSEASFMSLFQFATLTDAFVIVISSISALGAGVIVTLPPVVLGRLVNVLADVKGGHHINADSYYAINLSALYLVYIAVAALIAWFVALSGFSYVGIRMTRQMRIQYMASLLRQNMAIFDGIGTGQIIAQLGADLNAVQDALSQKLSIAITATGTLFATWIVGLILYWKLTLILSSSIVLTLALFHFGHKISVPYSKRSVQAQSISSSAAEDALVSIRETTALRLQKSVLQNYDGNLSEAKSAGTTLKVFTSSLLGLTVGTGYLNVALAFWQGSVFLSRHSTSLMAVVAIVLIFKTAAFSVLSVAHTAETFSAASAAAQKMFQMLRRPSPIDSSSTEGVILDDLQGSIEFSGVTHIYPSRQGVTVTENLSVKFPVGKTTAIVGSSGAGKSSIAKLLMRFYEPVDGQITLDGVNIENLNIRWLRGQIQVANQDPFLFDTSVFENIEIGFKDGRAAALSTVERREKVERAAKLAHAHDFIMSLPDQYETVVGFQGCKLSGGQKQRILIARCLVSESKILVLDEATSALDTKTENQVQESLRASSEGRTTLVIAHRLSTIRQSDHIAVLESGKLVEQGTHNDLMSQRGRYFQLVHAQKESSEEQSDVLSRHGQYPISTDSRVREMVEKRVANDLHEKEANLSSTPELSSNPIERKASPDSFVAIIKFVLNLGAADWKLVLVGITFSILAGFEEPASAILFGYAVQTLVDPYHLGYGVRSAPYFWAWMFFLLAIIMTAAFAVQGSIFGVFSQRLIHRTRRRALTHILSQNIAFFDEPGNSAAALTSFLSTEVSDLAGISSNALGTILIAVSTLISGLVVGLVYGWKFALVCASLIPLLVASGFFGLWTISKFEQLNEKHARASAAYAGEAVMAMQTVVSLTREPDILRNYQKRLELSSKEGIKASIKASAVLAVARAGANAAMALGFWYGGSLVLRGEYTLLQFVIVFASIITSAYSAGLFFSFTPDIGKAHRSASGLKRLFARVSTIDPESSKGIRLSGDFPLGHIEFRDVSFAYPGAPQHLALRDISFTIPAGSAIALVGRTGCGKSTIVSLLERFYDPTTGAIFLDGLDISSLNIGDYRRCIGFVGQEPGFFRGSIKMNLLAGADVSESVPDQALVDACKTANIYDFIMSLPDGFDTAVGNRGGQLSGGQKQRLALARALICDPKILALDEATSAVDAQSEALIQEALEQASRGRTTITIAHRLSTIKNADMILVLEKGRIVETGSHERLFDKRGAYYELVLADIKSG